MFGITNIFKCLGILRNCFRFLPRKIQAIMVFNLLNKILETLKAPSSKLDIIFFIILVFCIFVLPNKLLQCQERNFDHFSVEFICYATFKLCFVQKNNSKPNIGDLGILTEFWYFRNLNSLQSRFMIDHFFFSLIYLCTCLLCLILEIFSNYFSIA